MSTPALEAWIAKHRATLIWRTTVNGIVVSCYHAGPSTCIVCDFGANRGWDIYTSVGTLDINETLADATERMGLPA